MNHLGHFALTGLLLGALERTAGARVVTLSSLAHRQGRIDLASFRGEKSYRAWREYSQSKLACLMFALELARRLERTGSKIVSVAAHPGGTKTDLQRHNGPIAAVSAVFAMSAPKGALPTLYAATADDVRSGDYVGPNGIYELWGHPARARVARRARDEAVAAKLWATSEELTGVRFL